MFKRNAFFLMTIGLGIISVLIALWPPNDLIIMGDRLFIYGIALWLTAAVTFLIDGKFGFTVVRGVRALFKGTSSRTFSHARAPMSEEHTASPSDPSTDSGHVKSDRTMRHITRFLLLTLFIGALNIVVSMVLIVWAA